MVLYSVAAAAAETCDSELHALHQDRRDPAEATMENLYGKYPKKIICQCNAGEMNGEADTIQLNNRCPICHSLRRICIPKAEARMKSVSGIPVARKTKEPVLTTHNVLEPLVIWDQILNDHFNDSLSYFSYFMTLPERMFWIYTSAFLTPSPKQKKAA
jgi:hypothetical protein